MAQQLESDGNATGINLLHRRLARDNPALLTCGIICQRLTACASHELSYRSPPPPPRPILSLDELCC